MKPTEHLTITERPGTYITVMSDSSGPIIVVSDGPGARASRYTPEEAAKLGLAVLEAAGWPNEHLATTEILRRLRELDEHVKAVEAEARELAELEAEAQCLRGAFAGEMKTELEDFSTLNSNVRERWLAVARRARELAKEATK